MSGSTSSSPTVQDVLKLWTSIPTRALIKRYQRTASVDKARASAVCTAYKQFIALKILSHDDDDALLAAPPAVHAFWREHVLDTAAYSENCRTLCGRILHHSPDVALDDEPQQLRRCQRTVLAYKKHFGGDEPKPVEVWDFGRELPTLSSEEERALTEEQAPAAKRAKSGAGLSVDLQALSVSIQAPFIPLRTVSTRSDASVAQLFQAFVDASGASHLVAGRRATPPTTRLRHGNDWLHDLQLLGDAGVREGSVIYVACPQERHSRDQLAVSVKDVASGEVASLYVRACDSVHQMMRHAQDALGAPADCQQLIFRGAVLEETDTLASSRVCDGCTVQMVVGKKRAKEAEMSPGGTWRVK